MTYRMLRKNEHEAQRDNWKARALEYRLMVQVFRGCIENRIIPSKDSPCHRKVIELLTERTGEG